MRCPNCGNENPDDYTFCDECGARLAAQEGEMDAAASGQSADTSPSDAGYAPASQMASTTSGSPDIQADGGGEMGGAPDEAAQPTAGSGVCPNCGAATVPGEAFCSECGAELSTADTSAEAMPAPAEGAAAGMEPYMGGTGTAGAAPPPTPDAEMAVTEDTMLPATEGAQAGDGTFPPTEPSMPGVMPMGSADEGAAVAAPAMPGVAEMPGMAADQAGASTWANEALRQLADAQASMSQGDWVAYGQHMSSLKSFLEEVAGGTVAATATATATGMPAAPMAAPMAAPTAGATEPEAAAMPAEPEPLEVAPPATMEPAADAGLLGTAPAPAAFPSSGATMARLVVISTGAELPLPQQDEITVGREDPSSGIFPDIDLTPYGGEDGGVSRRHARLLHSGNDYFVEDLQSTNYTKLDGQRLPARVREKLEDGARLDFGRIAVIFRKG